MERFFFFWCGNKKQKQILLFMCAMCIVLCIAVCTRTLGSVSCTRFFYLPLLSKCVCGYVCAGFHWLGVRNFRMKYLYAMCDHFQVELFNGDGWHLVYMVCLVSLHELYIIYTNIRAHIHTHRHTHIYPKTSKRFNNINTCFLRLRKST